MEERLPLWTGFLFSGATGFCLNSAVQNLVEGRYSEAIYPAFFTILYALGTYAMYLDRKEVVK
jgi:hypothetical protein